MSTSAQIGALAEPWRRFLAAALDSAMLFALAVGYFWLGRWIGFQDRQLDGVCEIAAPVVAWLYVLVCWALGATIGMRLLDIEVRRLDGRAMDVKTAAVRTIGFLVACLPAKLGLLGIVVHPRRQGWHDEIARTIVVHREAPIETLPATIQNTAPREPLPAADISFALRRSGWALAAYALLAICFTLPLALHFRTTLAGLPGDSAMFVWNIWYFSHALSHSLPLTSTQMLFYPQTVPLALHTMSWLDCALAAPLIRPLGPIGAYNTIVLGSLTLTAYTSYLLLAALTRSRISAAVCGPIFGFSPFFMVHALGHLNLISAEFVPLFALLLYAALTGRRAGYAVAAGIVLALAGYCDLQYLLIGLILGACLICGVLWRRVSLRSPATVRMVAVFCLPYCLTGILLLPLLLPALHLQAKSEYASAGYQSANYKADLLDFVSPKPIQAISRISRDASVDWHVESTVCPGLIAALLAGFALRRRELRQALSPWLTTLLVGVLLACGPFLTIAGRALPAFVVYLLLGFPGVGFAQYYDFYGFGDFATRVSHHAVALVTDPGSLDMPYAWLSQSPMMAQFRAPARLIEVALLGVSAIAAFGLREVLDLMRVKHGGLAAIACAVGFGVCLSIEYCPFPFPVTTPRVSGYEALLARSRGMCVVVDVPVATHEEYDYEQTIHGKPVMDGALARVPSYAFATIRGNDLLNYLAGFGDDAGPLLGPRGLALQRAASSLRAIGVRHILVHKDLLSRANLAAIDGTLGEALHLHVEWNDKLLRVYRL